MFARSGVPERACLYRRDLPTPMILSNFLGPDTKVRELGKGGPLQIGSGSIGARARWSLARLATTRRFLVAAEWAARTVCQLTLEHVA